MKKNEDTDNFLSRKDLAKLLRSLARNYKSEAFGNPAASNSLRELAVFVEELDIDSKKGTLSDGDISDRLQKDISALSDNDVEKILEQKDPRKSFLVDLAFTRFGIPKSRLNRISIEEVKDAINSALNHERSINIISDEATRSGSRRSS